MSVDDLVTWLREQIDEDERTASALAPTAPWDIYDANGGREGYPPEWAISDRRGAEFITFDGGAAGSRTIVGYIARHDPARVLREVEAKRRIIDEYEEAQAYYQVDVAAPAGEAYGLLTAVKLLASVYADREGFREEWRP